MRPIIVIGGGWSVSQYDVRDLRERGYVIGVNDSAIHAQCDLGISMDRLWAEHRWREYFLSRAGELWIRTGAAKHLPYHPRLRKFECSHKSSEMVERFGVLNGMNSGMVALNYAYQMRPEVVYMFGFDMCKGPNGEPYWYPPYPWAKPEGATTGGKYKAWAPEFETVAQCFRKHNISLVQVNHRTKLTAIPAISFSDFLKATDKCLTNAA